MAAEVQTGVSRWRPARRRRHKVARPLLLRLRARKPCCRLRRIFDGWYWRFINRSVSSPRRPRDGNASPGESRGERAGEFNNEARRVKRSKPVGRRGGRSVNRPTALG
jgi:hypothetical protein